MRRRWGIQAGTNWWISLGFHFDHTDPSITIHLPGIILCLGRCKQPGFRRAPRSTPSHPEDTCKQCGGSNVSWFAPSLLWNQYARDAGRPGILCPVCFIKIAESVGLPEQTWEVKPAHCGEREP